MKKLTLFILLFLSFIYANAQDPNFSQFFSSPLNINPALTARINSDWRMISNFRDQWVGPASPYATGTISFDSKILQNKIPNVYDEKNIFGIGGMLMYDHAMNGILKSVYGSANVSYNIVLATEPFVHRVGIGVGGTYGRRTIDFSRLTWQEQWVGYGGFNSNLPSGEAGLSNMKPFFSINSGLVYSISSEISNFDIGASVFHINTPKQTFLQDDNQKLAMRKVVHANFEMFLNDEVVLNTNAIYQLQDKARYYSIGGGLGYYLPEYPDVLLNVGMWYWAENSIIPYIGFAYKDFQFGLSYDVTISKLNKAALKPKTFEISLIVRGTKEPKQIIPCPWK